MTQCKQCGRTLEPGESGLPCPDCGSLDRNIVDVDFAGVTAHGNLILGQMKMQGFATVTPPPAFVIVWDPEVVNESEYAELVTAVGDVARASGGLGLQRIKSGGFGVPCEAGVPQ